MKPTLAAVKKLMKIAGTGFLATANSRGASVRPMSAWLWVGGELWLAAGVNSAKVADVRGRPAVEFCAMTPDFRHVRIAGRCSLSTRAADKRKMFGAYDWMKVYFSSESDPGWVVMKVKPARIRLMGDDMQYAEVALTS